MGFYNKKIYLTTLTTTENEFFETVEVYKKSNVVIDGTIQPIDIKQYETIFGTDIVSREQLFLKSTILNPGDVIVYNNKIYEVEKSIVEWDIYKLYAIKESAKEVLL